MVEVVDAVVIGAGFGGMYQGRSAFIAWRISTKMRSGADLASPRLATNHDAAFPCDRRDQETEGAVRPLRRHARCRTIRSCVLPRRRAGHALRQRRSESCRQFRHPRLQPRSSKDVQRSSKLSKPCADCGYPLTTATCRRSRSRAMFAPRASGPWKISLSTYPAHARSRIHGRGHHHETYERLQSGWHIKYSKLTRLHLVLE